MGDSVRRMAAAAAVMIGFAACGSEAPKREAPPPAPDAPGQPADLAILSALPSADSVGGMLAFVEQVSPEATAEWRALLAPLARSLPHTDPAAPSWMIAAYAPDGAASIASVYKVEPGADLPASGPGMRVANGWLAVGSGPAFEPLAAWALAALPSRPVRVPTLTLFPALALARKPAWVDAGRVMLRSLAARGGAPEPTAGLAALDALAAVLRETERLDLELDVDARRLTFDVRATPRAGTTFAAWTARGQPSDFALIPRLPTAGAAVLIAGRQFPVPPALVAEPHGGVEPAEGEGPGARAWSATLEAVRAALVRETAAAFQAVPPEAPGGTRTYIVALSQVGAAVPAPGGGAAPPADPAGDAPAVDPRPHDGVTFELRPHRFLEVRAARWDDVAGIVLGHDNRARAERLVDVSRGKVAPDPLPPGFAAAVEEARRRRDTAIAIVDVVAFFTGMPGEDGITLTMGFDRGAVRFRLATSPAQLAGFRGLRDWLVAREAQAAPAAP